MYFLSAAIGPVEVLVDPTVTVHVLRKGSVLDALISKCAEAWVIARSRWQRVALGQKSEGLEHRIYWLGGSRRRHRRMRPIASVCCGL